jgi:hypothetical protein
VEEIRDNPAIVKRTQMTLKKHKIHTDCLSVFIRCICVICVLFFTYALKITK